MSPLQAAITQIRFARDYTQQLLDTIPESNWFVMPQGVTHVAWQVGHLAMAQYRLTLERIRGVDAADETWISSDFLTRFGRNSVAQADPEQNLPISEIRATFDRVYAQCLVELPKLSEAELAQAPLKSHPLCQTKLECLCWSGAHEMLHAGQIGLLRRLLGQAPMW